MTKNSSNGAHHCSTLDGDNALYLTQRNGAYYYQRRIPDLSQPFFNGKKLIKKSLKTKDKSVAVIRARQWATEHDVLFKGHAALVAKEEAQRQPESFQHQTDFAAKQEQLLKLKELADYGSQHWAAVQALQFDPFANDEERESDFYAVHNLYDGHLDLYHRVRNGSISDYDLELTHEWKVFKGNLPESQQDLFSSFDSKTKRHLYIKFVTGLRSWLPTLFKKLETPLDDVELPTLPVDAMSVMPAVSPASQPEVAFEPEPQGELLSVYIETYLDDRALNNLRERTLAAYRANLSLLVRVLGDRPIGSYSREDARQFRDTLLKLPANINATKKYKAMSISELITLETKTLSRKTVNNIVANVGAFTTWCVNESKPITDFHFRGLKLAIETKANEERSVFSSNDLAVWFSHSRYHDKKPPKPYHYWIPLLGLFTGARLNELCQLYAGDIFEIDGVWCISITNEHEDQTVKTKSSRRAVPIHSRLIELGFIEFAHSFGDGRIFPEIPFKNGRYSDVSSKWFLNTRDRVLPNAQSEGKAFHSFRHGFADDLKQQGHTKEHVAALMGHSDSGETFNRYGKDYRSQVLRPVIESLTFRVNVTPWSQLSD